MAVKMERENIGLTTITFPSTARYCYHYCFWYLTGLYFQSLLQVRLIFINTFPLPQTVFQRRNFRMCWCFTVYRSPMRRHGSTSVQPVDVFWSYRVTVSARTAAVLLASLARRPGTLSRIISGIRTLLWTTSSACWKRFCSQRISAISALDVSRRCALPIYILLTYLFTLSGVLKCQTEKNASWKMKNQIAGAEDVGYTAIFNCVDWLSDWLTDWLTWLIIYLFI